jgi:hypothetical protein
MFSVRQILSLGNVALSLVLGVVCLVLCFSFFPKFTLELIRGASGIKEKVVSMTGNPQYEIIARTVLHESSILLMGFTLAARVVTGVLLSFVHGLFSRGER